MMKMEIKLDEACMDKDGYEVASAWKIIDKIMEETDGHLTKEILEDGAVMYSSVPEYTNTFGYFGGAYIILQDIEWFAKYVTKWLWYDNDSDETQPFEYSDVLAKERTRNPLFRSNL